MYLTSSENLIDQGIMTPNSFPDLFTLTRSINILFSCELIYSSCSYCKRIKKSVKLIYDELFLYQFYDLEICNSLLHRAY